MGDKEFYEVVAKANEGVEVRNVKSIFLWYDLLSFAISFQLIFIFSHSAGMNFLVTLCSAIFIILTDTIIKISLERDPKNYIRLRNQMSLVKLWTIPLIILSVIILMLLCAAALGLF